MSKDLFIDCYGASALGDVTLEAGSTNVHFVFSGEAKGEREFHFHLFVDDAARQCAELQLCPERCLALLAESPIRPVVRDGAEMAQDFTKVFTHWKTLTDLGAPFEAFPFGTTWINWDPERAPLPADLCEKPKLVSFVGSIEHPEQGAYSMRMRVAEMAIAHPLIDAFGKGIQFVDDKRDSLVPYAFSIAMENDSADFYFTEKLVDCLLCETIPIYFGCPSIGELFDLRGMIVFQEPEELAEIIDGLSPDEYRRMLPFAKQNKQRLIDNRWHTMQSLYQRLADRIVDIPLPDPQPAPVPNSDSQRTSFLRRLLAKFTG